MFEGNEKDLLKAEKLIKQAMTSIPDPSMGEPSSKKRKIDIRPHAESPVKVDSTSNLVTSILKGEKLSDLHMDLAQSILKNQFPGFRGLQMTVLQTKKQNNIESNPGNRLQIIHSRGDHWIAASNVGCENKVNVYDSAYSHLDEETKKVVCNLFQTKADKIEIKTLQKQVGGTDCGLFSIAALTAIAFNQDPSEIIFCQEEMRSHLATCLTF